MVTNGGNFQFGSGFLPLNVLLLFPMATRILKICEFTEPTTSRQQGSRMLFKVDASRHFPVRKTEVFIFLLISELNKTHVHYWLLETLVDVSFYLWTEPEQLFTLTCHVISIPSVKPDASLILWFQYEYGEKYQTISIKCFSSGVYFEAKRIIFLFSSVYAPKNGQSANTFSELLSGCDRSMLKP